MARVTRYAAAVLSVKELKALARRLDDAAFAQQLGPFVLVQRPIEEAVKGAPGKGLKTTQPMPARTKRSVLDFEDLWVATLPPLADSDSFSRISPQPTKAELASPRWGTLTIQSGPERTAGESHAYSIHRYQFGINAPCGK